MRTAVLSFLLVIHLPILATGGEKGTYDFLRLDFGARPSALYGSFVSMTDDPNMVFYNPASLPTLTRTFASAGFLKHLLDIHAGSLSFGYAIPDVGTLGLGVAFVDYGSFEHTDASMNILGTLGGQDLALVGGMGVFLDEFTSVGMSLKFIYSSLAGYRSTAAAADIGVLYVIPSENITIGASVRNLGTQISAYIDTREPLPLDVTVGITKRPEHLPVFLNLNFHKLNESQGSLLDRFSAFTFGAEFLMSESLRLRLGYSNEKRKELKLG
ncbi:MAG: PorV/PorQ family protein, partial [Bacteroidota bacterium]